MYRLLDQPYQLPLVIGAVPYWDLENSTRSASDHSQIIDEATPWWYGLATDGAWAPAVAQAVLHDQMRRRAHVADLATLASTHGYTGLQLDYEDLTAADRDVFSQFSITRKLHLAAGFQIGGVELRRRGAEDPALWAPPADRHRTPS